MEATALLRTVMEEIDVAVYAFDEQQRLRQQWTGARIGSDPAEIVGSKARIVGSAGTVGSHPGDLAAVEIDGGDAAIGRLHQRQAARADDDAGPAGDLLVGVAFAPAPAGLVERNWLHAEGIPGRPWFKHLLYAARFTYAHLELPALTEAAEAKNWPLAKEQTAILEQAVARNVALLREVRGELEGSASPR